jgi:hypothetical protein
MEYECGPLLLFSQDKIRMLDFLSDVFEFDVDSTNDSVQNGPLNIKIMEQTSLDDSNNTKNNGIIFSFKVSSELKLKEIMSKYNFFLYRKSNLSTVVEKLELLQTKTKKILTISDIDQRLWRFEYDD